jgi:Flp pilus assembly protein TadG
VRVRRLSLVRLRDEQHGAVLMIVAICMIIMLGMLVLVFDLGRSVGIKRTMVAGADAAALAAAHECAMGQPMGAAQTAATTLIVDNNGAATMTDFQADPTQCSGIPGQLQQNVSDVTVKSSVPVEYFFAPIFGLNNGTVTSEATARWGPAIGVANPVPLRLTSLQVNGCLATPIGSASAVCAFGFDNDDPNSGSTWGVMNFPEGWPAQGSANPPDCGGNSGGQSQVIDYMAGGGPDFTPVLWALPDPIWVCADPGLGASTINWIVDWLNSHIGLGLIFPVMGPQGSMVASGGLVYPIVGFIKLTVMGAWKGQQAKQHCVLPSGNSSAFCVQLQNDGTQIVDGVPGNGAYYDQLKAVRLVR